MLPARCAHSKVHCTAELTRLYVQIIDVLLNQLGREQTVLVQDAALLAGKPLLQSRHLCWPHTLQVTVVVPGGHMSKAVTLVHCV